MAPFAYTPAKLPTLTPTAIIPPRIAVALPTTVLLQQRFSVHVHAHAHYR